MIDGALPLSRCEFWPGDAKEVLNVFEWNNNGTVRNVGNMGVVFLLASGTMTTDSARCRRHRRAIERSVVRRFAPCSAVCLARGSAAIVVIDSDPRTPIMITTAKEREPKIGPDIEREERRKPTGRRRGTRIRSQIVSFAACLESRLVEARNWNERIRGSLNDVSEPRCRTQ